MRLPFQEKDYPGLLIVGEGTSRSGKTTFLRSLAAELPDSLSIEWNSHPDFRPAVDRLKRDRALDPVTHSLVSVTDYALTFRQRALPVLRAGGVVLSDRYLFTSWVRDTARGVPASSVADLCTQFPRPDLVCYFEAPAELTLARFRERPEIYGHYATGSDIWPDLNPEDAFRRYFEAQAAGYGKLAEANDFVTEDHRAHALARMSGMLPSA